MRTIQNIIDNLFYNENIKTKNDFKKKFNISKIRKKEFYNYIKCFANKHYLKLKNPFNCINNYCRKKLIGYKSYNEKYNNINIEFKKYYDKYKNIYNNVINDLIKYVKKNKLKLKVCKRCHDIGHTSISINCKYNIYDKLILKNKIKKYLLNINFFTNIEIKSYLENFSIQTGIKLSKIEASYKTINQEELLDREINIIDLMNEYDKNMIKCYECNKKLHVINNNSNRIWKNKKVCDKCWASHENERINMWKIINNKYPQICYICNTKKKYAGERFHFDHINMFVKNISICSMIYDGYDMKEIYEEIKKSKRLCYRCHQLISLSEKKFGFIGIKQNLTRDLNNNKITKEFYENEKKRLGIKYNNMMEQVYIKLKNHIKFKNNYI